MKYRLVGIILFVMFFSFDSWSSQNMDVSMHGTSWIDTFGQFRFRSADNAGGLVVYEDEQSDLVTITFWDESVIVLNTDTHEVARYNSATNYADYSTLGATSEWNASTSVTNTLIAFAEHMYHISTYVPEPGCHIALPPGEPCPIAPGVNSMHFNSEFPFKHSESAQSSQQSEFCQYMEHKAQAPYHGHVTLESCARTAKYNNTATFIVGLSGCLVALPTPVGFAACSGAGLVVGLSSMEFQDRLDSCVASAQDIQVALDICDSDQEVDDSNQGGGSIAPGVNVDYTSPNPAFTLAMSQTVTCRRAVVSSPTEGDLGSQIVCNAHL